MTQKPPSDAPVNDGIADLVIADLKAKHQRENDLVAVRASLGMMRGPAGLKACTTLIQQYSADPRRLESFLKHDTQRFDSALLRNELVEKLAAWERALVIAAAFRGPAAPGLQ